MEKIKWRKKSCYIFCHGLSELILFSGIRSNLRLQYEVYARDNGRQNIQLGSILKVINTYPFDSKKNFMKDTQIDVANRNSDNFKIFIVLDFDEPEISDIDKENFLSKNMFKGHWMYDYIVPIFSMPNLDSILTKVGHTIDTSNKVKSYTCFINQGKGKLDFHIELIEKLSSISTSNLVECLSYIIKS